MYYAQQLSAFEEFLNNTFYKIMAQISPIDTKKGRQAFKQAELILAQQINDIREIFIIYEEKTDLLFNSENPDDKLALALYQTFLNGLDALLELKKQVFTNTYLNLSLEIKKIDEEFKAITN